MSGVLFETSAQTPKTNSGNLLKQLAGNSIEGVWKINVEESDDIARKIQTLIQKSFAFSDKALSTKQTEIPGISISIFPPERLVLAGGENEMTINEFYPDAISTRTFIIDGLTHIYQAKNEFNIAVIATEKEKKLLIETLSPRGNRMVETYELFADGNKLKVSIQVFDSNYKEFLTLQRIYDRAILDDFFGL